MRIVGFGCRRRVVSFRCGPLIEGLSVLEEEVFDNLWKSPTPSKVVAFFLDGLDGSYYDKG